MWIWSMWILCLEFQLGIVPNNMVVSWNGGTPSHHPFLDGIFHYKTSRLGVPPFMETPILGPGYLEPEQDFNSQKKELWNHHNCGFCVQCMYISYTYTSNTIYKQMSSHGESHIIILTGNASHNVYIYMYSHAIDFWTVQAPIAKSSFFALKNHPRLTSMSAAVGRFMCNNSTWRAMDGPVCSLGWPSEMDLESKIMVISRDMAESWWFSQWFFVKILVDNGGTIHL